MRRRFGRVRCFACRAYVFVYSADNESKLASVRKPLTFTKAHLGHVAIRRAIPLRPAFHPASRAAGLVASLWQVSSEPPLDVLPR